MRIMLRYFNVCKLDQILTLNLLRIRDFALQHSYLRAKKHHTTSKHFQQKSFEAFSKYKSYQRNFAYLLFQIKNSHNGKKFLSLRCENIFTRALCILVLPQK